MTLSGTLAIVGLACSALSLFGALWIVVPAPTRVLALVAVGASEWSLWLAIVGLAGSVFGLTAARTGATVDWISWVSPAAVVLGLATVGLASLPYVQAWQVARAERTTLSPLRALIGSPDRFQGQVQTVTYASTGGQDLQMDVYLPGDVPGVDGVGAGVIPVVPPSGQLRPAVIVAHGGSWSGGYRSESPRWSRWLAAQGYVVFDIDYRLAPQPNWQTATGDVKCAIGTVKRQSARWQVDPNRVALLGRSAGAHLSLLSAYSAGDAVLGPSCNVADTGVQAVVALYGPTDLIWGYDHPGNPRVINGRETLRRFLDGTPQTVGETYRRASPVTHVGRSTPPTLLFHGGHDQYVRVQQTTRLAERLRATGVPHKAVILPYAQHGFDFVFDGWGGQIAQETIARFLTLIFGGGGVWAEHAPLGEVHG